ncbi:MAG: class II fructose-bisphosphate aldolase [Planctomycetota bacterium]|jgi:ketose-bisphosphate aldolase
MPLNTRELVRNAFEAGTVIPAFNIPYLPMMEPVVRALQDTRTFGLIQVARLEWEKFEAGGLGPVREEYDRAKDSRFTRLHLDHVPVIDEDEQRVGYLEVISEALRCGYGSVMVDGSRLPLEENIAATRRVVEMAHAAGVPVEGEVGAVLGHEAGPLPPYEELYASGAGFTDPDEARRFVEETGVDWLSVAIGSVHGAVSGAAKAQAKVEARLNIERLDRIRELTSLPLVLHGGSGIKKEYVLEAIRHGIAKINIGTAIRQPYEAAVSEGPEAAQERVYHAAVALIADELEIAGSVEVVNPGAV